MNMRDRLLDFWQHVYVSTQEQIVRSEGAQVLDRAPRLADRCAAAADEAERKLVFAMRAHCGACSASGRVFGDGHPPDGSVCEACGGKGIRLWAELAPPPPPLRWPGPQAPPVAEPPTGQGEP